MNHGNRLLSPVVLVLVIIGGCFAGPDDPEDETNITAAPTEVLIGEDGEPIETTTTLPPDDSADEEEDDGGVLDIATLLPIESGRFEGEHWFKWKLGEPIPDPAQEHTRTYQLNIRSLEDDLFGIGYTATEGEQPFATGFCLDDRPNCANPTFDVEFEVNEANDQILFFIPEGTFGNATGLDISGFLITFPTQDSDPINIDLGQAPMSLEEKDPC